MWNKASVVSVWCMAAVGLVVLTMAGCGDDAGSGMPAAQSAAQLVSDPQGQLLLAVRGNEVDTVSQLLDSNPDLVSVRDAAGRTLLHHAAEADAADVAALLLDRGADVNALDSRGQTPMTIMGRRGSRGTRTYQLLESRGGRDI